MAVQNFDKLNILQRRSLPYDEYFGDMLISESQKDKRKHTALILEDVLSIILEVLFTEITMKMVNKVGIKQEFIYELYDAIEDEDFFDDEDQFYDYLFTLIDEIVDSTVDNMEKHPNDYDYTGETPYWVSKDRAQFIAENEANTLWNGKEFIEAIKEGKTDKIWMVYPDDNVRPTHIELNGAIIPIDAYFDVGGARMLYPKDTTSELSTGTDFPEEVINCRCTVIYV